MFFTIGNLLKAGPWLAVGELTAVKLLWDGVAGVMSWG